MRMASGGLRVLVTSWQAARLSATLDAGSAMLKVSGGDFPSELESAQHRIRSGLELTGNGVWSPFIQMNARHDLGRKLAKWAIESESGVRYSGERFDFEMRGRWLKWRGSRKYRESGGALSMRLKPASDGTGLSAALSPSWGRSNSSNIVWSGNPLPTVQPKDSAASGTALNGNIAYGMYAWRLPGLVTPNFGYTRDAKGDSTQRIGGDYIANRQELPFQFTGRIGIERRVTSGSSTWGCNISGSMRW